MAHLSLHAHRQPCVLAPAGALGYATGGHTHLPRGTGEEVASAWLMLFWLKGLSKYQVLITTRVHGCDSVAWVETSQRSAADRARRWRGFPSREALGQLPRVSHGAPVSCLHPSLSGSIFLLTWIPGPGVWWRLGSPGCELCFGGGVCTLLPWTSPTTEGPGQPRTTILRIPPATGFHLRVCSSLWYLSRQVEKPDLHLFFFL